MLRATLFLQRLPNPDQFLTLLKRLAWILGSTHRNEHSLTYVFAYFWQTAFSCRNHGRAYIFHTSVFTSTFVKQITLLSINLYNKNTYPHTTKHRWSRKKEEKAEKNTPPPPPVLTPFWQVLTKFWGFVKIVRTWFSLALQSIGDPCLQRVRGRIGSANPRIAPAYSVPAIRGLTRTRRSTGFNLWSLACCLLFYDHAAHFLLDCLRLTLPSGSLLPSTNWLARML